MNQIRQRTVQTTVLLDGIGHWNQQEAPEETNRAVLEFLANLDD